MSLVKAWAHFDYEERDGVATLTFSRPERLNSLTFDVYADIRDLTDSLRRRGDEIRLLVIRGKGRGFCSGWTLAACTSSHGQRVLACATCARSPNR